MDRPKCAFGAKELCRHFAHPTKAGVDAIKRAARFVVGMPRAVWRFPLQEANNTLKVFVDTDFGGCQAIRRSTSGGIALRGAHPIKPWSTTQTTIALSSGEAVGFAEALPLPSGCKPLPLILALLSMSRS